MKYWKPEGPGRFRLGEWTIVKDWASTAWDVYQGDKLMAGNCNDAPEAIRRAEELGA